MTHIQYLFLIGKVIMYPGRLMTCQWDWNTFVTDTVWFVWAPIRCSERCPLGILTLIISAFSGIQTHRFKDLQNILFSPLWNIWFSNLLNTGLLRIGRYRTIINSIKYTRLNIEIHMVSKYWGYSWSLLKCLLVAYKYAWYLSIEVTVGHL